MSQQPPHTRPPAGDRGSADTTESSREASLPAANGDSRPERRNGWLRGLLDRLTAISRGKGRPAAHPSDDIENRYRDLFENSRDALMVLAPPTWIFVGANQATLRMFGAATSEEFTALGPWDVSPERQPDGRLSAEKAAEMIETSLREGSHLFEWMHRRLNGDCFPADVWLNRIESGGQLRVQATVRDISERKANEQALREARLALEAHGAELERKVAARTAELEASRDEAERLARVKSLFLANMSHEIRTPLHAILGLARIGVRDSAGRAAEGTFVRILDAGEHLLGVINDILDYSKIEAGRFHLNPSTFRLGAVVNGAWSLLSGAARQKGLEYRIDLDPDLPEWVEGDAQRIQQILVNLLSNAIKFTEAGEVCLRVRRAGGDMAFFVKDTGIGMEPKALSRLFKPFEQLDGSATRKHGGTGLGLTISRDLARLMNGEIDVETTLGEGSCFTLHLPLPERAPGAITPDERGIQDGRHLSGIRILAAEDMEVNRLILEDLLERQGARFVLVENGRLALERLAMEGHDAFDLVLMDVQMPEMDGYEATRRIREIAPELPVIGLTAHALEEERAKGEDAGMVEHLSKPTDPRKLVAAVLRHARGQASTPYRSASETVAPADSERPAAASGRFDRSALLSRFDGSQEFIRMLMDSLRASHADLPARLRAAIEAEDIQRLRELAHDTKGIAGHLGASALLDLANRTQAAARTPGAETFRLAGHLASELEALMLELRGS